MLSQHAAGDGVRHLLVHEPQGKAHVVPAEVAQTTEWFQGVAGADVLVPEISHRPETETARHTKDRADRLGIVEDLAKKGKPAAVQEHDPVHELNAVAAASFQHDTQIRSRNGAGLLAE